MVKHMVWNNVNTLWHVVFFDRILLLLSCFSYFSILIPTWLTAGGE